MKRFALLFLAAASTMLIFNACEPEPEIYTPTPYELEIPDSFPEPLIPADNPMTVEKVALGKKLFYDPKLSADGTVSCASCHLPDKGFSDPRVLSEGVGGKLGRRHAMALTNIAYAQKLFWDGSLDNLEDQALHPIIDEVEMAADPADIIAYLNADETYIDLFDKAFGAPATILSVVRSLASFERTLISGNSPFDRYQAGDSNAISAAAKRGWEIFNLEKSECFHCHTGYNFTDESFQNNGLYDYAEYIARGDAGRAEITGRQIDEHLFKTPTLRNVELTAPYMHDGSIATLEEVIDRYATVNSRFHPNKNDIFFVNMNLNEQDKADLVAFLKSLTDEEFANNPAFRP
ncbi:MAG: cytochrome c peroxidase [Bacteroidota bacterium]